MTSKPTASVRASGMIMIEVLVAIVIILLSLVGLLGLQARTQRAEMEAYQRTQALVLVRAMVDSHETHRQAATCFGAITTSTGAPYVGTGGTPPATCNATGVPATDQAALDAINRWSDMVKGAGAVAGGNSVGAMINGVGCVSVDLAPDSSTPDIYTVAVAWQGLTDFPARHRRTTPAPAKRTRSPAGAAAVSGQALRCADASSGRPSRSRS